MISTDDTIRPGVSLESLTSLKPAFQWGESSTTAGNASGIGDGAAICIMTTRARAETEGLPVIGKWVGTAIAGQTSCIIEQEYIVISDGNIA